ncbi:MAG: TPM domain-containing protein [Sphingomonadaceae bacterium]
MKRRAVERLWLLICAMLVGLYALPVSAQQFPSLTGRVVDSANIIPDGDEAALTAKLAALESQSGRQVVVATIPTLDDGKGRVYDIADYGYQLGRAWGVGEKGANNGVILLIVPNDRKMRIEVGYGLEAILTDALSSVIITTQIAPRFKAGDYPGGIDAGVNAIAAQLVLPPEEAAKRARAATQDQGSGDGSAVIFWLFIFVFFILPIIWPLIFPGKRGRRLGAPIIIWGGSSGGSSWGGGSGGFGGGGGGFSGGGGSFGGGGASGGW